MPSHQKVSKDGKIENIVQPNPPTAAAVLALENKVVIINANIIIDMPNSKMRKKSRKNVPKLVH